MCNTFIFYFNRILNCFWKKCQVLFIKNLNPIRNIFYQTAVSFLLAEKYGHIFCKCFYIFINTVIWKKCHAILCERTQNICRKCFLIGKQFDLFLSHYQVRQYNRTAMYISAADVQQPCNVIQRSQHKSICFFFFHCFTDPRNFICTGFPCPFYIQFHHRFAGKCRAVFPYFTYQIIIHGKSSTFLSKHFRKFSSFFCTDSSSVKTKAHAFS